MDFGKFKYESALKARESRKNQAQTVIKEIKIRPKIDPHDYGTKKGHVERFLRQGDKVKVTIMFRGREQSRPELGYKLLQRLAVDVEELGFVESQPKQDGRNMIMVIGPLRKKAETKAVRAHDRASARAAAPASGAANQIRAAAAAAEAGASPRPSPPRPPEAGSGAAVRPATGTGAGAAARPGPAPSASRPRPAPPGGAAPSAGAAATASRPAAPKPAATAPRPAAPKPAAPRPSAPRPAAPKPAAPNPRARSAGAAGGLAG